MEREIAINGVRYPLLAEGNVPDWQTAEQGQEVRWSRDFGWLGGMGAFTEQRPDDYLFGRNVDPTTYPFLRLPPKWIKTDIATLGVNGLLPHYMFRAKAGGDGVASDTSWVYLLYGQYAYKIHEDTGVVESTFDFGAGAVAGRPALFDDSTDGVGTWYVPLGPATVAAELNTITDDSGAADTWYVAGSASTAHPKATGDGSGGYFAMHFAIVNEKGVPKLAMAGGPTFTTALQPANAVGYSADGTVAPSNFQVNDGTLAISDLIGGAELTIIDASSVFRLDDQGYAVRIVSFVGRHAELSAFPGSNAFQHGPYLYWPHASGIWRIVGDGALPIGPDADARWVNRTLDSFTPLVQGSSTAVMWSSVVAYGKWLYATYGRSVFAGELREDGTILWHGVVYQAAAAMEVRCHITDGPVLWFSEGGTALEGNLYRLPLDTDGSMRAIGGNRGEASATHQFWGPSIDGGPRLAAKNKQWRKMGVELEGDWDSASPLQMAAHLNGAATSTNVGSAVVAAGATEVSWTVGTTDRARYIIPTLKIVTTASHTTGDPRIRRWWAEGVTPITYAARIDLRHGTTGIRDWEGRLKNLRDLRGGAAVTIIPPEKNAGFTGYVGRLHEEHDAKGGYIVTVLLERYDWDGA